MKIVLQNSVIKLAFLWIAGCKSFHDVKRTRFVWQWVNDEFKFKSINI